MNIISYHFSPVYPQFLQLFTLILMEHPILKNPLPRVIIKAQQRSESNVLTNLPRSKLQKAEVTKMLEPNNFMK